MKDLITECIFNSARTTIDGGWRISFDLASDDGKFVTDLTQMKHLSLFLVIKAREDSESTTDVDDLPDLDNT